MTLNELFELLADKDFQERSTGDLFFPAYMYVYDPEKEYEVEQELISIQSRLSRPSHYLDVMLLDIFEEFQNYLKEQTFGKQSKFDFYIEKEPTKPQEVEKALKQDAYDKRFLDWLHMRIAQYFEQTEQTAITYVLIKGFGAAFPYIRAGKFMNNFEKYTSEATYKTLLFYPGKATNNYSLFGLLNDENLYRAIKLIN